MRMYRIAAYTGPSGLELCEAPAPAAPTGRQVLVRVRASSLNYRELLNVQGILARMAPLPDRRVPGSDGAGDVVAVGPDVRRVRPGDRVATVFYADWLQGPMPADLQMIGRSAGLDDGTLTEYLCVDEGELAHVPAHLSYEEAATLPCAGVTAWTALFDTWVGTQSDLALRIARVLAEAGIEIPFPQRDLHLRSADAKLIDALRNDAP